MVRVFAMICVAIRVNKPNESHSHVVERKPIKTNRRCGGFIKKYFIQNLNIRINLSLIESLAMPIMTVENKKLIRMHHVFPVQ